MWWSYLESEGASVFGDQEVCQVNEIGKRRIEKQVPNDSEIISCKCNSNADDISLHDKSSREKEDDSYWSHVEEEIHGVELLPFKKKPQIQKNPFKTYSTRTRTRPQRRKKHIIFYPSEESKIPWSTDLSALEAVAAMHIRNPKRWKLGSLWRHPKKKKRRIIKWVTKLKKKHIEKEDFSTIQNFYEVL